MFDMYIYRWRRWRIERFYKDDLDAAKKKNDHEEIERTIGAIVTDLSILEAETYRRETGRLVNEATLLDVDTPSRDDSDGHQSWERSLTGTWNLTARARAILRKQIDEEKTRRREVTAWWWKNVIIPAVTTLIGIIGATTGLVAVWKKH